MRWEGAGKITLFDISISNGLSHFLLTPRGDKYSKYRKQWEIIRWFIDQWSDLQTELMSAIISVIFTVITSYLIL